MLTRHCRLCVCLLFVMAVPCWRCWKEKQKDIDIDDEKEQKEGKGNKEYDPEADLVSTSMAIGCDTLDEMFKCLPSDIVYPMTMNKVKTLLTAQGNKNKNKSKNKNEKDNKMGDDSKNDGKNDVSVGVSSAVRQHAGLFLTQVVQSMPNTIVKQGLINDFLDINIQLICEYSQEKFEAQENSNFNFFSSKINTNLNSTASIMSPLLARCTVADVKAQRSEAQRSFDTLSGSDKLRMRENNINPMNFYSL